MIVYYRMAGISSTNPSPIFQEDKLKLNKLCLKSFVDSYRHLNPNIVFLLDHCSPEYDDMIKSVVPFTSVLHHMEVGINETCLKQYEWAKEQKDNIILFQECDYLYRPDTGAMMNYAINNLGLVSPYDHRNFYLDRTIHSDYTQIKLLPDDQHYRTTERNTMTFGIRADIFKNNYEIFKKYGYLDNDVWHEMRAKGHPIWVPIPSFATHMVKDFMAPSINWESIWLTLI